MIAEDEALIAMGLEDDLTDAGFSVGGPFARASSALEWMGRHRPDVAVLDGVLQDGPCLEIARELKARDVPFIVYSGNNEKHQHAPELAGAPWIDKPAPARVVVAAVRRLVDRSAPACGS